jgi:UDP-N-acetyl-D-glucosamine dehydrogenase
MVLSFGNPNDSKPDPSPLRTVALARPGGACMETEARKLTPHPRNVLVIGQGYVGLALAHRAVQAGHRVIGFDTDLNKIDQLRQGRSPIDDVTDGDVAGMLASGRYRVAAHEAALPDFDTAVVTVPTPLCEGRPDLSAVLAAAGTIGRRLTAGTLVILESTVAPGTTEGQFLAEIEARAEGMTLAAGDFHLGFAPERIDPGNAVWGLHNTPKVISGVTAACLDLMHDFYSTLCETLVPCATPAEAEMAKLLENTYRHVNIALINELARHAHDLGIDIWNVIEAATTKPYGFQVFYPGPGTGGHCLPVDPVYLSDRIESVLLRRFEFVDIAVRVNNSQPDYVVSRVAALLNEAGRAVKGATVLVLGVAYKRDTADARETPAAQIIELLERRGAQLWVSDPNADTTRVAPRAKQVFAPDLVDAARQADLTLLLTDHTLFPYAEIADAAGLVLDTRGRLPRLPHIHRV